jgi:hypothetical protein
MTRIELTDLERKKLSDAGRGFMAKHRSAQEIEIAELKNALALARQKKTLRDEFAMAALISYLVTAENYTDAAKFSYEFADAMMKERMK